jgi:hypothetical protein
MPNVLYAPMPQIPPSAQDASARITSLISLPTLQLARAFAQDINMATKTTLPTPYAPTATPNAPPAWVLKSTNVRHASMVITLTELPAQNVIISARSAREVQTRNVRSVVRRFSFRITCTRQLVI